MKQPTPWERAYIDYYNGRIRNATEFARAAGIEDTEKAWAQLVRYRTDIVCGIIPDPRDTYKEWAGEQWRREY